MGWRDDLRTWLEENDSAEMMRDRRGRSGGSRVSAGEDEDEEEEEEEERNALQSALCLWEDG